MIDSEGYRANVGIILGNRSGQVFWGRRCGQASWQFPQGGIKRDEEPVEAMFRELAEEVGLMREHVEVLGCTRRWLRYRIPKRFVRRNKRPLCIGQKQIWFMLGFRGRESDFNLAYSGHPEFDSWCWVDYWYPMSGVVHFKRDVYNRALRELAPLIRQTWWSAQSAAALAQGACDHQAGRDNRSLSSSP